MAEEKKLTPEQEAAAAKAAEKKAAEKAKKDAEAAKKAMVEAKQQAKAPVQYRIKNNRNGIRGLKGGVTAINVPAKGSVVVTEEEFALLAADLDDKPYFTVSEVTAEVA